MQRMSLAAALLASAIGFGEAARYGISAQPPPAAAPAQTAAQRLEQLPAALRERARATLAEPDETKRGDRIEALIQAEPIATLDFSLALLEEEQSPVVRAEIVDEIHHPIYSHGQHEDNSRKIEQLLPVLRDRADIYLAGHDHDMQHLRPEGRLHFFVAGSGGKLRPIEPGPRSLFAKSAHGFAVLEIRNDTLDVAFVGLGGEELYRYELK